MSASASPQTPTLDFRHHRAASQSIIDSTKTLNELKSLLKREKDESDKRRGKSEKLLYKERMALLNQQEQARKLQEEVAMKALQVQVERERNELKEKRNADVKSE